MYNYKPQGYKAEYESTPTGYVGTRTRRQRLATGSWTQLEIRVGKFKSDRLSMIENHFQSTTDN